MRAMLPGVSVRRHKVVKGRLKTILRMDFNGSWGAHPQGGQTRRCRDNPDR